VITLDSIRDQEEFIQENALRWARNENRLPTRDETRKLMEQYRFNESDPVNRWEIERFGERVYSMLDADKHGHAGWQK